MSNETMINPINNSNSTVINSEFQSNNATVINTEISNLSNIAEGTTDITWETSTSETGTYTEVQSGTSKTYRITASDANKYIRVKVTPVDNMGNTGTAVISAPVKLNLYSDPTAENAYYVALNGSDDNDGSIEKPFAFP